MTIAFDKLLSVAGWGTSRSQMTTALALAALKQLVGSEINRSQMTTALTIS